jgi:hypothetical protein
MMDGDPDFNFSSSGLFYATCAFAPFLWLHDQRLYSVLY